MVLGIDDVERFVDKLEVNICVYEDGGGDVIVDIWSVGRYSRLFGDYV